MVAEVMDRCGNYSELGLRRALANSYMLSSDVSAAYDPNYASVFEKKMQLILAKVWCLINTQVQEAKWL